MPWFRVDDSLAFHTKVVAAGNAAMGLWVRAGSWASQQLTDGFVPAHIASTLGKASEVRSLVSVGLWVEVDGGYRFHDWEERQPSRQQVEADRHAARERQRRAREASKSRSLSRRDISVSNGPPDPALPVVPNGTTTSPRQRGSRIPDDFAVTDSMRSWAATNAPGVNLDRETANFQDYWRAKSGKDATKTDWTATWRTWMRRAQENVERRSPQPTSKVELNPWRFR